VWENLREIAASGGHVGWTVLGCQTRVIKEWRVDKKREEKAFSRKEEIPIVPKTGKRRLRGRPRGRPEMSKKIKASIIHGEGFPVSVAWRKNFSLPQ